MSNIREEAYKEALEESVYNSRKEVEERYRNGEPLICSKKGMCDWSYWNYPYDDRRDFKFNWDMFDYKIIKKEETVCFKHAFLVEIPKKKEDGKKFDNGKPRWGLLPFRELKEIVDILTFGAEKYAPGNWQKVRPTSRYIDATFRHLTAWCQGEKKDPESGKSHLAHVVCNILFLMWFDNEGIEE